MSGSPTLLSLSDPLPIWGLRVSQFIYDLGEITELKNHLRNYELKGTHLFIRHGEAESNITGTACEKLDEDIDKCGLTELGIEQVLLGVKIVCETISSGARCIIVSSPLRRARETALILQAVLQQYPKDVAQEILIMDGLSERYYGAMNGMPYAAFRDLVAHHDQKNPICGFGNSESLLSFQDRITRSICYLDESLTSIEDQPIVFLHCTHMMVIKMLMTAEQNLPLRAMHCMKNISNGGSFQL
jgi:broad specificity phosphatase PhoE